MRLQIFVKVATELAEWIVVKVATELAEWIDSGRLFQRDRAQERKALAPVLVWTLGMKVVFVEKPLLSAALLWRLLFIKNAAESTLSNFHENCGYVRVG